MKRKHKHTPNQWRLHNYLKDNADKFVFRVDILVDLKALYFEPHVTEEDIRTMNIYESTEALQLNKDIRALKSSLVIKRILIGNSQKGIKYANEDEATEYFKRKRESIKKQTILLNTQAKKYGLNGQCVIQFTGGEKPFIESVMK